MNAVLVAVLLAAAPAPRVIQLSVTSKGFEPATVTAKKGEKLRLVVTRKTDRTCAKEVHIKDAGIVKELPLNVPVEIELTPAKAGQLRYACSMDMVAGVLLIE
ncbi:MAG TPA: cupredoxin domain-containing protein [Myxococcales bacterium]